MYKFSKRSRKNLDECHPDLILIAETVITVIDFAVIEGHRGAAEQNRAYWAGFSKLMYPHSEHNKVPSMAIDVIPYVNNKFVGWEDLNAFIFLAGHFLGAAAALYKQGKTRHLITSGLDWNRNGGMKDQSFLDAPHLQLFEPIQ